MKKTMMIAALFAASAFSAFAADVYSSNIVGYTKVAVSAGFNLLGSQFVNVGDNAALGITPLVQSDDLPGLDAELRFQSELKVWTGTGYATYGWMDGNDGTNNEMPEWDSTWLLGDMSDVANVTLPIGDGFWVKTTAPGTVLFKGEVSTNSTYQVSVSAGFNLVCNPFPTEISIQDVQSADLAGLDAELRFQTELKVWTGTGYATYGWMDGDDGTNNEMPEWDSKWLLGDLSDLADVTIGIGKAFWIKTTAPATITFTK